MTKAEASNRLHSLMIDYAQMGETEIAEALEMGAVALTDGAPSRQLGDSGNITK